MSNFISEDQIEQALLQRRQHVCGFDVLGCYTADPADMNDGSGRKDKREVDGLLRDGITVIKPVAFRLLKTRRPPGISLR